MKRQFPRRKLIYQRKSANAAQLTVLTWRESLGLWGSETFATGTAAKVGRTLAQFVQHFERTGQAMTLVREDWRRQTLPQWQAVVAAQNRKPWHA
ncbi:MAG: hypothetical protein ACO23P_11435 [Vulcanococcus sp.]